MPLYFAYGSNMDVAAMARRCPRSRPLALARLMRHRFFVMASGYASVRRDPPRAVQGLLWELSPRDVPALDAYEDVASGLFVKRMLPVISTLGPRRALVYVGASTVSGAALPGYMESVLAAARQQAMPDAWLRELAAWLPTRGRPATPAKIAWARGT